ncbi:MAG: carboxypeptidase M32 [Alicyclobacillus herbarius]|uniref:carboxypeptidase M32 n=1 Tax=Alicyclobacillus herbarius TaxID=122960 RepID=UPI0004026B38|nr:carboxypeptidase M32 [Alicyclobacillus herbarius]MCL6632206.1 carboxypeptidase M32 [Alicyclobacillus herbarius]
MSQAVSQTVEAFRQYVREMEHYQEALSLMYWDLRTGAPKKGVPLRSEAIGTLSSAVFRMSTSPQMEEYLNTLGDPGVYNGLDPVTRAMVREFRKEFDRARKIPPERYHAYVVLVSKAESVWEEAKAKADFALFRPYLEQIVAMTVEFVDYWGYKDDKYDTLLDQYEPGMTVAQLDPIFDNLRQETVDLLNRIVATGRRFDDKRFYRGYDTALQRKLSHYLLEQMGYDFTAGRVDETVHPFQTTINHYDTRVTTKFLTEDLRSNLFSTIHEGGHALYEQGVSDELIGTGLCSGTSMGIHESQSRFWENMIGRSRPFWEAHYRYILELFPSQFADISLDDFYRSVNDVRPSLIRTEADELTYNLHIMIRYEIEKGLINGQLQVADLPAVWREKMQEYLGVTPSNDAEGVLQDVHWSGGSFGYFPSYALGNIYAAQFAHALAKDIPDYMEQVRRRNLLPIKQWLNEHIHRFGKMLEPKEIVQQVTGEAIDAKYLIGYLKDKFSALYNL